MTPFDPVLRVIAVARDIHGIMLVVETFLQKCREGGIVLGD
jgi:hypothetical protein